MADSTSVIAIRNIAAGEEITIDYATVNSGLNTSEGDNFTCRCQARDCRGLVTSRDWMLPKVQEKYWPHFPPFVRRLILSQAPRPGSVRRNGGASGPSATGQRPGRRERHSRGNKGRRRNEERGGNFVAFETPKAGVKDKRCGAERGRTTVCSRMVLLPSIPPLAKTGRKQARTTQHQIRYQGPTTSCALRKAHFSQDFSVSLIKENHVCGATPCLYRGSGGSKCICFGQSEHP
ncbi:nuclear protein set [Nannochloropsis gaditana]|uniref:Nuclear protein set n=1 Tax=Nannochloropsis gaditana TaxID=72520 RepID=W7U7W8_9STRA|nr:nuclear protein set [Nannochloropsis gaditana]